MAAPVCELPSIGWEGLWESLIYEDDVKTRLLDYIYATVVFSDADVDCGSLKTDLARYMRANEQYYSQYCFMEPDGVIAWSTGNREDIPWSIYCSGTQQTLPTNFARWCSR